MPASPDLLSQLSNAIAARAVSAKPLVAAIRLLDGRHLTGSRWRADLIVASEQVLPQRDDFEIVLPGGAVAKAKLTGRDAATNIALLKLEAPASRHQQHATSCWPCTRAIQPGESSRAGRWWWESGAPKECGMHCAIETGGFEHELHAILGESADG